MSFSIRDARDEDSWDLIGLIAACWSEYPGVILDVHGEAPELLAVASHYQQINGRLWIAESDNRLVGSIGVAPSSDSTMILTKLYVARNVRGQGLASKLIGLVEEHARNAHANRIELWSDTRFLTAHRLYEHLGWKRQRETRDLKDLSNSIEFHFVKDLSSHEASTHSHSSE